MSDTDGDDGGPGQSQPQQSYSIPVIFVVSLAIFTDDYIYSSVIPILPFLLEDRVGFHGDQVQKWTSILLAVYAVATVVGSPLIGWLSDFPRLRKKVYLAGLLLTALSTVAFALGRKIWILLLGRIALSLSSSVVRSAGMAMLKDSSAVSKQGRVMGFIAIPQTLGQLAGPLASGWLYETVSYEAVWIAMGAILCIDAIARLVVSDPGAADRNMPISGPDTEHHREGSTNTGGHSEESPLLQRHHEIPSSQRILLRFLLDQRVVIALWLCFLQAFLRISLASTLPIFLQRTFAAGSGQTGVLYLMLTAPVVTSIFIGILFDRIGGEFITATGLAVGIPSFVSLRFVTHESPGQTAVLVILLLLCGSVMLLIGVPSMATCSTVASEMVKPARDRGHPISISGQVFSTVRTARAVGQALAPIFGAGTVTRIGWGGLTAVLGAICAASFIAIVTGFAVRRNRMTKQNA